MESIKVDSSSREAGLNSAKPCGSYVTLRKSPDISEPLGKTESSQGDSEKGQVRGECQEMLISFLQ